MKFIYIVLYRTPTILAKENGDIEILRILVNDPRTTRAPTKISFIIFKLHFK